MVTTLAFPSSLRRPGPRIRAKQTIARGQSRIVEAMEREEKKRRLTPAQEAGRYSQPHDEEPRPPQPLPRGTHRLRLPLLLRLRRDGAERPLVVRARRHHALRAGSTSLGWSAAAVS
ncbi:hypothetical protein ZWY2020_034662 [Hordeum vulgare]|nr:hypothetical protein ZWY2020_034662 [Hordeum vulgare]